MPVIPLVYEIAFLSEEDSKKMLDDIPAVTGVGGILMQNIPASYKLKL